MSEPWCSTCTQPYTTCHCPPPDPPDTLRRVVELQQAERAKRIGAIDQLMIYAERSGPLPQELSDHLKAQCDHAYTVLLPPRKTRGGTWHSQQEFLAKLRPILQKIDDAEEYPSQARVVALWEQRTSVRQFQRWFSYFFEQEKWPDFIARMHRECRVNVVVV